MPSLIVCSIARSLATGSAPGCARQIGHVRVFSAAPYSSAQRQNILVRVFRCACTSRPTTVSQPLLDIAELLLGLAHGRLDVELDLDHCKPVLERALRLDQPELALARLELELHVADEHGARAVEHARLRAEHALHGRDEIRGGILEAHRHRSGMGTGSKPIACSSACPIRNSVFSENCGPISCTPTGRSSERPQGTLRPGRPAMQDGIVSRSLRYIASGFSARAPSLKATLGDVGEMSTSNRSKASACSRASTVRTFCAWP